MNRFAFRRTWLPSLLIALTVLATPAILLAHAKLVRSTPSANQSLDAPPRSVRLWFSERPEVRFTTVSLTDSAGHRIPLGNPEAIEGSGIAAAIDEPLHAGKYTVAWRTAASDGHPSNGTFSFLVASGADAPAAAATTPAAPPSVIVDTTRPANTNEVLTPTQNPAFSTAMRWAELVALMTLIGAIVLRLAVVPAAKWSGDILTEVNDRLARLARPTVVLFALGTLTRGFEQAELFPVSGSRFTSLLMLVERSRWGHSWAIGLAGAIVALIGLSAAGRKLSGWVVASIGVVAICMSESLTGHAGAVHYYAVAVASDVAHMLGAGGWLGGLTALLLCAMPVVKRLDATAAAEQGSRLLRAFHDSAVECVAIVVLSAAVSSWTRFPRLDALWTTPYGQMLLRKLFFVAVVAGFGLYHWRRIVRPAWNDDTRFRFQRTALFELIVGAVVVAFTALLISQPLP